MRVRARFPFVGWTWAALALALGLALVGCSPFGLGKAAEPTPTNLPPPTETPIPVLPTYTPTRVSPSPTAPPTVTPTEVPASAAAAQPTATLTPRPAAAVAAAPTTGGGETTPSEVSYVVVTRVASKGNLLQNPSFEEGFDENGVALGWTAYANEGAVYAWSDETNGKHIADGSHAQLMRVMGPGEPDRFVGLYQTVKVVPGETYTLTMHGLIRSSTADTHLTPYGHRIQWAVDDGAGRNWYEVNQDWGVWKDTGWNDVKLDERKPQMNAYMEVFTPESDQVTLYVRGWTKWPIINSEAKYYLDAIHLNGPVPGEEEVVRVEAMPTTGGRAVWIPIAGVSVVLAFAAWEVRKMWLRGA